MWKLILAARDLDTVKLPILIFNARKRGLESSTDRVEYTAKTRDETPQNLLWGTEAGGGEGDVALVS